MKKTNISIIGTAGIPANYGGFETLVEHLTSNLNSSFNITVYCSSRLYKTKLNKYNGVTLQYINLNANGAQSILYDIVSIYKALKNSDTILILGVSGCIILPIVKLFSKKKIIVNIDGLEWKRNKWNKFIKIFLKYSEKIAVNFADIVIGDNKVITSYIKSEYNKDSFLIPYGADHVTKEPLTDDILLKYSFLNKPYAFKVCRIEPENNIHIILEAFKYYLDLNLVIVGNWSNSDYGMSLKGEYSKLVNIYLLDPIYNQKILNQLRSNCYIYIHGHSAGGTNPSLVEAMYLNLPILAYDIAYNKETTQNRAIYFTDSFDLLEKLKTFNRKDLKSIGDNMKTIAVDNYTWSIISKKYAELL